MNAPQMRYKLTDVYWGKVKHPEMAIENLAAVSLAVLQDLENLDAGLLRLEGSVADSMEEGLRRRAVWAEKKIEDLLQRVEALETGLCEFGAALGEVEGTQARAGKPEPEPEAEARTAYNWEVRDNEFEILATDQGCTYEEACRAAGKVLARFAVCKSAHVTIFKDP